MLLALADSIKVIQIALAGAEQPIFTPDDQGLHVSLRRVVTPVDGTIINDLIQRGSLISSINNGLA